jgi:hypothetical protein
LLFKFEDTKSKKVIEKAFMRLISVKVLKIQEISTFTRVFFQDFGNMTHTHGIGNFSDVLLKIGKKMQN